MLRDILQTLRSMGLQFTLEEQTDSLEERSRQASEAMDMRRQRSDDMRTRRLTLTINF